MTSITFTWKNPSTFFGTQTIGLGNMTFVPAVATSPAALALFAGLFAIGRHRTGRAAA